MDYSEINDTLNKYIIIKQLKNHINELEQNDKIFEKLNAKFIKMQEE